MVRCNDTAAEYTRLLSGYVKTPVVMPQMYSACAQYTIGLKDNKTRDNVMDKLKTDGIPTAVYYAFAAGLWKHIR